MFEHNKILGVDYTYPRTSFDGISHSTLHPERQGRTVPSGQQYIIFTGITAIIYKYKN